MPRKEALEYDLLSSPNRIAKQQRDKFSQTTDIPIINMPREIPRRDKDRVINLSAKRIRKQRISRKKFDAWTKK